MVGGVGLVQWGGVGGVGGCLYGCGMCVGCLWMWLKCAVCGTTGCACRYGGGGGVGMEQVGCMCGGVWRCVCGAYM